MPAGRRSLRFLCPLACSKDTFGAFLSAQRSTNHFCFAKDLVIAAKHRSQTKTAHFWTVFVWLRERVSNTTSGVNTTNETQLHTSAARPEIILTGEEKSRLVKYFDVLIEMDRAVNIRERFPRSET